MLRHLMPDRLSQWLVALVVGAILATQAFALTLYHVDARRAIITAESRQAAQCLAGFAQVLAVAPPDRRKMIMQPLLFGPPPGDWGEHAPPPGSEPFDPRHLPDSTHPPPDGLRFGFDGRPHFGFPGHGPEFMIHLPDAGTRGPFATVFRGPGFGDDILKRIEVHEHLPDGTFLTLDARPSLGLLMTPQFVAYIGSVIAVALAGSIWVIALATRPLRRLSDAADRFGTDVNAPPLLERGPREVKQAAAAFNRMQQRLRQFLTDRTHVWMS